MNAELPPNTPGPVQGARPAAYAPAGSPPAAPPGYIAPPRPGVSALAIVSLVLALLGLVGAAAGILYRLSASVAPPGDLSPAYQVELFSGVVISAGLGGCLSWVLSVPAVITGHIALGRIKRWGGLLTGRGVARAGLVLGYVDIAAPILVIILSFVLYIYATTLPSR